MQRQEPVVVSQTGHHGHADKEHGHQQCGHQPMQNARQECELCGIRRGGHGYFSTSAVETALGSLCSPSRRMKDCEYAAERALNSGSSDGDIPAGSTSGSKLMSRVALESSLSMVSIVMVPTSICCLSAAHELAACAVGSPGWPTMMIRCQRNGPECICAISASNK